jgi:NADPH:quinone reductase-like Zn-dependent oxidoreductase
MQANLMAPSISKARGKKLVALSHNTSKEDLVFMKELIEAGKVKPVIDRHYSLSEVAEALRYYGDGHARGKVVITLEDNSKT